MKQLIKRYAAVRSDLVGFVQIGPDALTLIKKEGSVRGILNGCELFASDYGDDTKDRVASLLGNVIEHLCHKNGCSQLTIYANDWKSEEGPNLLRDTLACLGEVTKVRVASSRRSKVNYHPMPKVSEHIDQYALSKNLGVLNRKISNIVGVLRSTIKNASIVSGRKLVQSMWGAPETQKYLDNEHSKVASQQAALDKAELYQEMIARATTKIAARLNSSTIGADDRIMLKTMLIPDLIECYEGLKKLASDVLLTASPLLHVDRVFMANTQYPATWFVSEEVMNDLREDCGHIASFLGEVPKMETNATIPLDVLASQIKK